VLNSLWSFRKSPDMQAPASHPHVASFLSTRFGIPENWWRYRSRSIGIASCLLAVALIGIAAPTAWSTVPNLLPRQDLRPGGNSGGVSLTENSAPQITAFEVYWAYGTTWFVTGDVTDDASPEACTITFEGSLSEYTTNPDSNGYFSLLIDNPTQFGPTIAKATDAQGAVSNERIGILEEI
jgi:hypothetical protein